MLYLTRMDTNDTLTRMLLEAFTSDEERQFVVAFQMYLNHADHSNTFVISLDDVWKWVGFSRKDPAKRVLIQKHQVGVDFCIETPQNIIENNQSMKALHQDVERFQSNSTDIQNGGHNKEIIRMTIDSFKNLCMMANTEQGKRVRQYYIKMEKVMHDFIKRENEYTLQTIENAHGRTLYTIECEHNSRITKLLHEKDHSIMIGKHNALLVCFTRGKRVFYMCRIMVPNNDTNMLIKVGESDDLPSRIEKLRMQFKCQVYIIEVIESATCNRKFEDHIKKHPQLANYKYNDIINNTRTSTEVFAVRDIQQLNWFKSFVLQEFDTFGSKDNLEGRRLALRQTELDIELLNLQLRLESLKEGKTYVEMRDAFTNTEVQYVTQDVQTETFHSREEKHAVEHEQDFPNDKGDKEEHIANAPALERILEAKRKAHRDTPIVQIYSPTDLTTVVRVFDSVVDAVREMQGTSYTAIRQANQRKTIYKNYRWHFINRADPNPNESKLIETNKQQTHNAGMLAILNPSRTVVLSVHARQKSVAEHLGQSVSTICVAVKYNRPVCTFHIQLWDDVDIHLKNMYLQSHTLPYVHAISRGRIVQKLAPDTYQVVEEYTSQDTARVQNKCSVASLKNAIANDELLHGYRWCFKPN